MIKLLQKICSRIIAVSIILFVVVGIPTIILSIVVMLFRAAFL